MKKFLFSVMALFVAVTMSFAQTATPYTEGFEEYASGLPTSWEKVGSGTVEVQASTVHTGTKSLKFSGATSNVVALPAFDVEINTLQVTLYSRPEGNYTQCGSFDVGYVTDVTDASTFVAVSTWSYNESPSAYLEKNVMLNSAPAGARLAFRHRPTATYYYWFVDDVVVEALPSCYRPDQLATSEILSTGATINWVAGNGETQFQYVVMPKDVAADWTNATTVNATTATITGLESNTAYDFYVRAICSESEMSTANVLSFRTNCSAQAIPYTNDFESETSNAVPSCWTRPDGQSYPYVSGSSSSAYEGSKSLYFYGGGSTSEQFIVLPQFANAINTLAIKFYYKASVYSTYGVPQIGYVTNRDDMTTFVALATLEQQSSYTLYEMNLDAAPANAAYIAIRYGDGSSSGSFYLDNLTVKAIPTCRKPVSLVATPVSTSSATITWAAGNNETTFEYVYALAGEDADWTNPTSVTALTATVTGLEQNSDYVFYVRANCGNEEISEENSIDFHAQRYCTPAPTKVDGSGITAVALGGVEQTTAVHKTTSTAPLYADNSALTFEVAASTATSIDVTYATGYTYGTVIWVDWNNDMDFTVDEVVFAGTSTNANPTTLNCPFTVPATQPEGTYRLRIGGADGFFDDFISGSTTTANSCSSGTYLVYEDYSITVTAAPSCTQPASFTYDSVTAYGAKLIWTAGLTETQFQYVAVPHGTDVNWTSATLVTGLTTTINTLTPETAYDVYLRASCGETEQSDSVMLTFTTIASCVQPTMPVVSNETASGATFAWKAGHGETDFQYVVMTKGTAADWTAAELVENDTTVTVTGLNANTEYDFFVRAYCAQDDQSDSIKVSFRTACDVYALPFEENFNELTSGIPSCWDNTEGTTTTASYRWNYFATGYDGAGVRFNSYGNSEDNTNILATPAINLTVNAQLTFMWKNPTGGAGMVLISANGGDRDTLMTELTGISAWTEKTIDLSAYTGQTVNIYFHGTSNWGNGDAYLYLDNVKVAEIPNCLKPTGLTVIDSTITTTSATLTCTAGGSETNWYVSYKAAADEDWTIVSGAVDTPYVLNGLTANTAYQVRMAAVCGNDTSEWTNPVSFRTACGVYALPFEENFNTLTSGIPSCWDNTEGTTTSASSKWSYYATGYEGKGVRFNSFSNSKNNTNILATPAINLTVNAQLTFMWKNPTGGAGMVLISANGGDRDTLMTELTGITEWTEKTIDLSAYTGQTVNIYFHGTSNYGNGDAYLYLDNVKVAEIPNCLKPTGLTVIDSTITTTSATLNCVAGGSETNWYVSYKAAADEDWTIVSGAVDTPYTLTGLTANTAYQVIMAAACGNDTSEWTNPVSFRTACGVYELPFEKNFNELTSGIPSCWDNTEGTTTTASYQWNYYATGYDGACVRFNSYSNSNGNINVLATPAIHLTINSELSFMWKNPTGGAGMVLISANGGDRDTLMTELTGITEWTEMIVDLSAYTGQTVNIYFHGTSNYGSGDAYLYLDNVSVKAIPTCRPLASISTTPARTSVAVTLTPKVGQTLASAYDLVCSTTELNNEALETAQKINVTGSPYTITGLERETQYYIYVRANCGEGDVSEWVSTSVTTNGLVECDYQTVGAGTSSTNYLPLYGYHHNSYSQQLYTSSDINHEAGAISSIAFEYTATNATTRNITIYMANTDATSLSSSYVTTGLTEVFAARNVTFNKENKWFTLALDAPFAYTGGNVVVAVYMNYTEDETEVNSTSRFRYTSKTGAGRYQSNNTAEADQIVLTDGVPTTGGSSSSYRPNINFAFCRDLDPCPTVTNLTSELLGNGTTEARISWTAADADYLSAYEVVRSLTPIADFSEVTRDTLNPDQDSIVYTDLVANTKYYVYVRAICEAEEHSEGSSVWDSINFTTNANCPKLDSLVLSLTATNAFKASWKTAYPDQELSFRFILSTDTLDEAGIAAAEPVMVYKTDTVLSNLLNDQMYYFYVASACGAQTSKYILDSIKTPVACQAVVNLEAARVAHNRALITWNKAPFATETSWEIGFVGNEANAVEVDTTMHMFIGLTPETAYQVYVKALCGEDSESEIDTVSFTTASMPGACAMVGSGTYSSYSTPFNNYFKNAWTQTIYAAELIGQAGLIQSLQYQCTAGDELTDEVVIYMAHTTMASASTTSDWVPQDDLVQVYANATYQHPTAAGWVEIMLDTPFDYNGSDNLAVIISSKKTDYSNSLKYAYTSATNVTLYRRSDTDATCGDYPTATGTRSSERPNIQFCFEPKACPDVTALTISDITPTTATATWEPMGQETSWNIAYATAAVEDPASLVTFTLVNAMTYPLSGLEVDQDYWFYVQPVCTGADSWRVATFRTVATCFPPTALVADSIEARSALVCWRDTINATGNYTVAYGPAAEFDEGNFSTVNVQGDTCVRLTNLIPETNYKFKVRANCDDGRSSRYSTAASFRTAISCYAPTALVASDITISTAVITWTDLHDAAAYRVYYGEAATFDLEDEDTYSYMDVENDTTATLTELNDSTNYKVMVKSVCGENDESAFSADITFRTANTYPYFMPAFTAVPSDWKRYSGLFTDTVRTANLTTTTSGWSYKDGDAAISTNHVKLNIWGTGCKYWFVSPAIDMTGADSTAELVFDAALCDFGDPGTAIESTTNVGDDKFAVIISRDGGLTWLAADRTLWAETADADYQYTSVPATGQHYTISLAQYAGEIIRVAFYGESTTSGGDNDFHIGNISLRNTVTYTEEICQYKTEEDGFDNHGFEEASTDSVGTFHFERINETTGAYETFDLTIHELIYWFSDFDYAYVGDYFELPYIHFTVEEGVKYYSIEEQTVYGCDSVWEVFFEEIRTAEIFPTEYDVLAEGDTINWRGHKITVVGDYADTVRTVHGGVMEIHSLTVSESIPMTTYRDTVCQYDEFDNHGFEEASSDSAGTFHFEGDNIEFYLTVNPFTVEEYDRYLYPGDHYSDANFEEFVATIDTSYILVGTNVKGCDSIILMHVIINTVDTIRETFEMPENDTIWHGITITEPGMYYYTEPSFLGGDSIRYILTVTAPVTPVEGRTFELVTEQLSDWSGNYLIVFSDNKAHATVSGGNKKDLVATSGELTITSDNKITTADSCFVTLTAMGNDGYSILLPNGNYLNRANNSCAQSETAEAMTIGYTANGIKISGDVSGSTYYLYCNANNGSPVYRFYVDKTGQAAYALPRLFKEVSGEGPATAIETINTANEAVKVILNGNLYIIRDNQWYDATGRLTSDPRK